jgi:hypothetical protein
MPSPVGRFRPVALRATLSKWFAFSGSSVRTATAHRDYANLMPIADHAPIGRIQVIESNIDFFSKALGENIFQITLER